MNLTWFCCVIVQLILSRSLYSKINKIKIERVIKINYNNK